MLVQVLFILSAVIVLYTYAGHPAVLYCIGRLRPRTWAREESNRSVAVFVSAFNEEKSIGPKIRNLLEQDYRGPLSIVIANDGSSDRTADVVRSFDDPRIVLHDFKRNRGKAAMQNQLVPELRS